eukprot:CAMPEP_0183744660 /NCGR_PEP_ID=MMETSP0737-20130205/65844_1 /TAXON_ID=385413 /ORGANISM="Thalassiosira miniscula, Strain CCMP1093" /LENGTH=117 /DNA_ID=CAMNT_0025980307 /DNA_START=12 /DNA_END=365 /DNA_ORIENTATION=+
MTPSEREHYVNLARDAKAEYEERLMEYRATGNWSPFQTIDRIETNKNGVVIVERFAGGPWVRIPYEKKNELEREIEEYEQVIFPPRPAAMEEEHGKRVKESLERRRRKIREEGLKYY